MSAGAWRDLPPYDGGELTHPQHYQASDALTAAVNVALVLGKPLLLTGEPGCGKSELARRLAWELDFPLVEPLRFSVKSTTEAQDLFYTFDTVGRFREAYHQRSRLERGEGENANAAEAPVPASQHDTVLPYLNFQALGAAILLADDDRSSTNSEARLRAACRQRVVDRLPGGEHQARLDAAAGALRSVVLIDEIDKAQREVPNDILNEIDRLEFDVPELFGLERVRCDEQRRPIVVITSNSESPLPEAFLRRCVYHHLELPSYASDDEDAVTIESIVRARVEPKFDHHHPVAADAVSLFRFLREANLQRAPGLAELLDWLYYVASEPVVARAKGLRAIAGDARAAKVLTAGLRASLLKHAEDQREADDLWRQWARGAD